MRIASFGRPVLTRPIKFAGAAHASHTSNPLSNLESGDVYQHYPATPSHSTGERVVKRTALQAIKKYGLPVAEGMTGVASLGVGIAGIYSCAASILIPGAIISTLCFITSVKNAVKIHRRIVKEKQQEAAQPLSLIQSERPSRLRQYALPMSEATLGGVSLILDNVSFAYCKPEIYYPSVALTALGLIPGLHGLLSHFMRTPEGFPTAAETAAHTAAASQPDIFQEISEDNRLQLPERCQQIA